MHVFADRTGPGSAPKASGWRPALVGLVSVIALVAGLFAGGASTAAPSPHQSFGAFVPGQVLVRFRSGTDTARVNRALGATTIKSFDRLVPGLQLVGIPTSLSVSAAVAAFDRRSEVAYAQPNRRSHIDGADKTPNDPRYPEQWDWPKINAPGAWDLTTGKHSVVVGDIDTGMQYTHDDLAANAWQNTAECNGQKGVDDDSNGYVDDCHGIDTINHDSDPFDDPGGAFSGHGTHTAGTIGAVGNNGTGVTGENWKVQILPCKSHGSDGNGSIASIIECYQYMVIEKAAGYDIVSTNNSYGGCPEACGFDQATMDGINGLNQAGILFAVAAGNNASNNDLIPVYPANYFLPNVIAVAATTSADGLASFSDYGVRTVSVGAPGQSVLSTYLSNGYAYLSGTSMATPHVAGLAGLIHAYDTSLNEYQIRNLIISGGDNIAALAGKTISGKRVNAFGSLTCSNQSVFGLLRPLEFTNAKKQTVAALNIDCAAPAGGLTVTIKPGGLVLTLKDRGTKADLAKHDGIYSVYWKPAAKGTYTLKFSNGQSYTVTVQ